ncbi:PHP-associated domain-containing protein [Vulgatibacter incomptus]|uniref:Polymerase/histidinol phosphatase N-terminal domain-containing protein n=1 Tax=Vulgatibacter incomptus TaxID=1391653 RepID=A0A0K1PAK0_9BACT|nr:PHP domain-containing protein [Vulgatibacter incomptus]AKU90441.1 hypothetical protein AKJ08_0828 [Vulgatibacter incomptus]
MLIDLHVHSSRTPGCSLDPAEAVARAQALGLDGICFTDLDTLGGVEELHALREKASIAVLVGMEAVTNHGHFLCFFPDPAGVRPEEVLGAEAPTARPARDVVEAVLAKGGAVVAAHPYDRDLEKPMGDFVFTLRSLTAVEGYTGTRRVNVNELAIEAADHLSVPCVGGSGAMAGYDEIGTAATLFKEPVRDEAELVRALRDGAVWAVAVGVPPRFHGDDVAARPPREERGGRRPWERRGGRGGGRGRGDRRGR